MENSKQVKPAIISQIGIEQFTKTDIIANSGKEAIVVPQISNPDELLPEMTDFHSEDSFNSLLNEYVKTKRDIKTIEKIEQFLRGFEPHSIQSLFNKFISKLLTQEKGVQAPPMMKRDGDLDRDRDKGLILYQLKYAQQRALNFVLLLKDCQIVRLQIPGLEETINNAIECFERATAAAEMRDCQNQCIVKLRKTPPKDSGRDEDEKMEKTTEDCYVASTNGKTIAEGINVVLEDRKISKEELDKEGITAADMFFADLNSIEDMFSGLIKFYEKTFAHKNDEHMFRALEIINKVSINSLEAVRRARKLNPELYSMANSRKYIWTASMEKIIKILFYKNIVVTAKIVTDYPCQNKENLCNQAFLLSDIILSEMEEQIKTQQLDQYNEYVHEFIDIKQKILENIGNKP